MERSTAAAAIALILAGSAATAATNGGMAGANRAWRPSYVEGGWQCPPGFVWRNAGRTDWLCVDAAEARRIAEENGQAAQNWVEGPDGNRSCRSGLVRRGAFKSDFVCVDPLRRERVQTMNLALYSDF
jgi:hypothetical protein